jgi:hypothetical protein
MRFPGYYRARSRFRITAACSILITKRLDDLELNQVKILMRLDTIESRLDELERKGVRS